MTKTKQRSPYDLLDSLAGQFPKCFVLNPQLRRPLKVGIRNDIVARGIGMIEGEINAALATYTRHPGYLHCSTSAGAVRIDLSGDAAGTVTAEEAKNARERLGAQSPKSTPPPAPKPEPVRPDGLAELRVAAERRKNERNATSG